MFNFAYNYCGFFNNLVFLEGPTKQEFDPHGDFKGKVGECSSTFSRLHIGCLRKCEIRNFMVRKKLDFPCGIQEFDAFEVPNLRSIDAFLLKKR